MIERALALPGITRRGLLVGAGLAAAPFIVRSRPATIHPVPVPDDRIYPRTDLLVHPRALYQAIVVDRRPVKLLDTASLATFRDGHIPGAAHVWWQDTMELNSPYYGSVLKPDDDKGNQGRRVRFLERLGLNNGDMVVVYGERELESAARVCWFLRFLGYQASVLDGGLAGWLGIDAELSSADQDVAESANPPVNPTRDYYLFAGEAIPLLGGSDSQLIDLRDPVETESGPSAGLAIPGAIPFSRSALLSADGLLLDPNNLRQLTVDAGIDLARRLFLIAPTGLDTATAWLALSLLGAEIVTIIDGGWRQWLDAPGAPVIGNAASWSHSS
jgi:thiosulfate/3-mercaptopyruvate sulfurtransferase